MHPEDLVKAIDAGAKLGGSDWKYGWPHKFYVSGIPDPGAGELRKMGKVNLGADWKTGLPREPTESDRARYPNWKQDEHGCWFVDLIEPAPATTRGKWYNTHLQDLEPATFAVVADILHQRAGIVFEMRAVGLHYSAPHRGYQA